MPSGLNLKVVANKDTWFHAWYCSLQKTTPVSIFDDIEDNFIGLKYKMKILIYLLLAI